MEAYIAPSFSVQNERENRRFARSAYNRVGLGVFLFLLVPQVVILLATFIIRILAPQFLHSIYFSWMMQVFALYLTATPITLLVIGRPREEIEPIKKEKASPLLLLITGLAMITAASFGNTTSNTLMSILEQLTGQSYSNTTSDLITETPMWIIFLIVVIIGPVFEELVFRRAILNRLLPYGEKSAILTSALMFGFMHGNFFQLFYTVGVGILLGYLYTRTRNFLYPLLYHIAFNFIGSILPLLLTGGLTADLNNMTENELITWVMANLPQILLTLLYSMLYNGAAVAGLVLLIVFARRRTRFNPCLYPQDPRYTVRLRMANPGMILFTVLAAFFLLLSLVP